MSATLTALAVSTSPSRAEVEDFLFLEAHLLDEWRMDEWFTLFAGGASYEVPAAGAGDDVTSDTALFYIADDYMRLRFRVERLKSPAAHAEFPRSKTIRLISNVRVLGAEDGGWKVRSAFMTQRSKNGVNDIYVGHHLHRLTRVDGELKIAWKRSVLDHSDLRPHGRVSIIL